MGHRQPSLRKPSPPHCPVAAQGRKDEGQRAEPRRAPSRPLTAGTALSPAARNSRRSPAPAPRSPERRARQPRPPGCAPAAPTFPATGSRPARYLPRSHSPAPGGAEGRCGRRHDEHRSEQVRSAAPPGPPPPAPALWAGRGGAGRGAAGSEDARPPARCRLLAGSGDSSGRAPILIGCTRRASALFAVSGRGAADVPRPSEVRYRRTGLEPNQSVGQRSLPQLYPRVSVLAAHGETTLAAPLVKDLTNRCPFVLSHPTMR